MPDFGPIRKNYVDLPILTEATIWETVPAVNSALQEHEFGRFQSASWLADAMDRDDRIVSVTETRINSLLGLPLSFQPNDQAGKSATAKKIAEDLKLLFCKIAPRAALAEALWWRLRCGFSISELRWNTNGSKWLPVIRPWHLMYSYWDWSDRKYKMPTQSDALVVLEPEDPKWWLWTPNGHQRGWMKGLVRALALPWLIRKFTYRDWSRYSEKHGLPITKAITRAGAEQKERDKFRRKVSAIGRDTTVETVMDANGEPVYDLELLEATADTYKGFQFLLEKAEDSLAILFLGQNLTTQVREGSRAAAQVQDKVRGDLLRADAMALSDDLQRGPLLHWVAYNYDAKNAEELVPKAVFETDPPEDKGEKSKALFALGQALNQFNAAGFAVDKKQLAEDFAIPVVGDGEMKPIVPGKTDQPQKGGKNAETEKESLSRDDKPGYEKGQDYADKIADDGVEQGRKVLMPDLAVVLEHVRLSKSPDELKGRLLKAFGHMNPMALARVLERGTILARMNGMHSVLEDI